VDGRDRPGHDDDPIGTHRLRDGSFACGVGLAFGHADASSLQELAQAAVAAGAIGFRTAPNRALIAIGLTEETMPAFAAAAERLGFIVRAGDPRRRVIACAGAPVCASGHVASRSLAPLVAETAARCFDETVTIHVSGCAKGCARSASASLTIVGTEDGCALIANGSARDKPCTVVPADELPAAIARFAHEKIRDDHHV